MSDSRRSMYFTPGRPSAVHRPRVRPERPCPCECGAVGFCDPHRARLAGIREALNNEVKNLGQYAQRSDQRKKKRTPTCNNPECWEPRVPPRAFCAGCDDAGWVEEE